jgi:uncharacterized protein YbjT (DUF2867 family)
MLNKYHYTAFPTLIIAAILTISACSNDTAPATDTAVEATVSAAESSSTVDAVSAESESLERILVVGASGRSGVYIIKALEAAGRSFRPMTSNIERARGKVDGDYDWVEGDVRDIDSMNAAMVGVTHIISALGATQFEGPNSPEFVDWGGTKNLVDAALLAGVKHFVIESAAGVTQENNDMNKYGNVMDFKLKAENYLRDSGLPYTIVRPGGLESVESEGKTITLKQGDDLPNHGGFSRADVAALLIAAVGNPDAYNKAFEPIYDEEATAGGWQPAFSDLLTDTELSQQEP